MPKLVLVRGNCDIQEMQLIDSLIIGRGINSDLKILDNNVSRQHARIDREDDQFIIRDLGSTNGTTVNGLPIIEKILSEGDQLQIGKTIFLFEKDSTRIYFPRGGQDYIGKQSEVDQEDKVAIEMEMETRQIKLSDDTLSKKSPRELIKAYRKLSIIFEIGKTLSSHTQLMPLLSKILDAIFKVLPAHRGLFFLTDPFSREMVPIIVKKTNDPDEPAVDPPVSRSIIQHVQQSKKGVLTSDLLFLDPPVRKAGKASRDFPDKLWIICVPLFIHDQMVGLIWIDSRDQLTGLTADDLELLTALAQQTSLAMENIRLTQDRIKGERLSGIGEMVSSIAHEIKNPLSSILIYADLLRNLHNDADQIEYCQVINNEINRLLEMTNQILDYSQTMILRPKMTDVPALVDEVIRILEQEALRKKIKISRKFHPLHRQVNLDGEKIRRVILNILLNAIQVCLEGSLISVSTDLAPQGNYYRISIADNGPDIPENMLERIFQPFFSTRQGGTGLGLAICQRIVEEHQGRILVESQQPEGVIFHIDLPLAVSEAVLPTW